MYHWRFRTLLSHQPPPFFAGNRRPEGLPGISRGKEIQQTLPRDPSGTTPYFVSLFDPKRNIPFYSAYKVTPQQAPLIGTYTRKDVKKRWRNPPGELHSPRSVPHFMGYMIGMCTPTQFFWESAPSSHRGYTNQVTDFSLSRDVFEPRTLTGSLCSCF